MKRTLLRITVGVVAVLTISQAVAKADVVLDWNAITVNTIAGQNPFAQARFAAITEAAVFEAVNAITADYEPYLGTITAPPGGVGGSRGRGCCARRAAELLSGQCGDSRRSVRELTRRDRGRSGQRRRHRRR